MSSTALKVAKYTLLPGILPRIKGLFFSGFDHFSALLAQVYVALRLLPANHPYVNPANHGRFGVRHVMREARSRLIVDRAHLDQVVLYYTLLFGMVLLIGQFGFLIAAFTTQGALAGGLSAYYSNFFVTPSPNTDIAFNLLDRIFAFPGIFDSDSIGSANSFHTALHTLFHFYNLGILAVAMIVFSYLLVVIVAETAQSGTPFGRRFNRTWAPIRLIFVVGLLMPLSFGMNGGQLLTLYIAKLGSGLATNGWIAFVGDLGGTTPLGDKESLIAMPHAPTANGLAEYMFVVQTCVNFQKKMFDRDINGYQVNGPNARQILASTGGNIVGTFEDAVQFSNNKDILIRFGEQSDDYNNQKGHVRPICGEMVLQVLDRTQPGALYIQNRYFQLIGDFWGETRNWETASNLATRWIPNENRDPNAPIPASGGDMTQYVNAMFSYFNGLIAGEALGGGIYGPAAPSAIEAARNAQIANGFWDENFNQYGWAGAAIWYNKLAEMNGSFIASVHSLPRPTLYPEVMEFVQDQKRASDTEVPVDERFRPYRADGTRIDFINPTDIYEAQALYQAQQYWRDAYVPGSANVFIDTVGSMFGLGSLFSMRENTTLGVHPMIQLVGLGRSIIESAVVNLGFSVGSGILGGLSGIFGKTNLAATLGAASKFAMQIALIGISIGLILYYVIPFMPFIYFFFAVGSWVKTIFELMLGIPLWAIAHIRIDGQGLPGPRGMDGYYLILEVFIRPILMIIGLVGGLVIFGAQMTILNEVWDLVTSNVTGFNRAMVGAAAGGAGTTTGGGLGSIDGVRGMIDVFFFTILYAIAAYMMAIASFKLTDSIPDTILRWIGASVSTYGQDDVNPAEGLISRMYFGTNLLLDSNNNTSILGLISRN